MEIKNVLPGTRISREVRELYEGAFLAGERIPFSRMLLLNLVRPSVKLQAYYEDNIICGFTFVVVTECYVYVDYLVINPAMRGKGYGSRIMAELLSRFQVPGIGECLEPIPGDPHYEEDLARVRFWEKLGFQFYGYQLKNTGHGRTYLVNSTGNYNRADYFACFDHLSFGPGATLRRWKRKKSK